MKILVLAYKFPIEKDGPIVSGEVKNPYNFSVELSKQGYDVTVLSIDSVLKPVSANLHGIKVFALPDIKIKGIFRYLYRAYTVLRWMNKNRDKFDLVHSHASFSGLGFLFSKNRELPFFSTPHGTNVPEIATELQFNPKDMLRRVNAYLQMKLDSYVYRSSKRCISVSAYQVAEMQSIYKIPPENIEVVYNGVPPRYQKSKNIEVVHEFDFLFVGRAAKKKGLDIIVQLANLYKLAKFKVVLGTARFKTVDDALIEKLCSLENVNVEWAVDESRLPAIYQASRLLLVPSRGYESLPTVILEAIRSKTWVIATNAWGNTEVIIDQNLLFEEDNIESIVVAIEYARTKNYTDYDFCYKEKIIETEVSRFVEIVNRHIVE